MTCVKELIPEAESPDADGKMLLEEGGDGPGKAEGVSYIGMG